MVILYALAGRISQSSLSCGILDGALQCAPLWHVQVVIGAQVLDQMVLAREAIATLAGAVVDGTITENGVMHAGLMALQICETGEGLAAVVAGEGFSGSSRGYPVLACCLFEDKRKVGDKLTWIEMASRDMSRRIVPMGNWAWAPLQLGSCFLRSYFHSCCSRSWTRSLPWLMHRRQCRNHSSEGSCTGNW